MENIAFMQSGPSKAVAIENFRVVEILLIIRFQIVVLLVTMIIVITFTTITIY